MEDISKVFENEKLLEKVAAAETREDAKKVCKEEGLEVTDADLDAVAGGLSTTAKVLIGVGGTALAGAGIAGGYKLGKRLGWWGSSLEDINLDDPNVQENLKDRLFNRIKINGNTYDASGNPNPIKHVGDRQPPDKI